MEYLPYQRRKAIEAQTWKKLVDQLAYEINRSDLERDPTGKAAVGRTLNVIGVKTGVERNRFFGRLMGEVKKHPRMIERQHRATQHSQDQQDLIDVRQQENLKDAYAHQMRQPRDSWDNTIQ